MCVQSCSERHFHAAIFAKVSGTFAPWSGTGHLVPPATASSTRYLVPGTWCMVFYTRYHESRAMNQVPGTPGARYPVSGPGILGRSPPNSCEFDCSEGTHENKAHELEHAKTTLAEVLPSFLLSYRGFIANRFKHCRYEPNQTELCRTQTRILVAKGCRLPTQNPHFAF